LFFVALLQSKRREIPSYLHPIIIQVPATGRNAFEYALFSGQGTNEAYFYKLQCLHGSYDPFVQSFISTVPRPLLLHFASVIPGLILLVQLTPGERRRYASGMTSHSRFRCRDRCSFFLRVAKAVEWLLGPVWCVGEGSRRQQPRDIIPPTQQCRSSTRPVRMTGSNPGRPMYDGRNSACVLSVPASDGLTSTLSAINHGGEHKSAADSGLQTA
jgi:hypothetical protein